MKCPKKETETTQKNDINKGRLFFIICLIVCAGIIIWVKSYVQDSPSPPPVVAEKSTKQGQPKQRQIILVANFDKGYIVIKNENDFDWTNTKITIANGATNQYSIQAGTFKSGETKTYKMSDFINMSGERYNSNKYVPKQVLVNADNASGGREY